MSTTDIPVPLRSEYSVAELIEFGQRIAALYGPKAVCTFVVNCGEKDAHRAHALVTPRQYAAQRFVKGESWVEVLEEAEKDAAVWLVSNREMLAADIGVDA